MKNSAFITGANRGIGLEVARQLGRRGALVLLGVRDTAKGEAAADETAKRHERLDILVNNAGIMPEYAQRILTPSQLPLERRPGAARRPTPAVTGAGRKFARRNPTTSDS